MHKHRCGDCGTIWEHARPVPSDFPNKEAYAAGYHAAHNCPTCGKNERQVYFSDAEQRAHAEQMRALFHLIFGEGSDADVDSLGSASAPAPGSLPTGNHPAHAR